MSLSSKKGCCDVRQPDTTSKVGMASTQIFGVFICVISVLSGSLSLLLRFQVSRAVRVDGVGENCSTHRNGCLHVKPSVAGRVAEPDVVTPVYVLCPVAFSLSKQELCYRLVAKLRRFEGKLIVFLCKTSVWN